MVSAEVGRAWNGTMQPPHDWPYNVPDENAASPHAWGTAAPGFAMANPAAKPVPLVLSEQVRQQAYPPGHFHGNSQQSQQPVNWYPYVQDGHAETELPSATIAPRAQAIDSAAQEAVVIGVEPAKAGYDGLVDDIQDAVAKYLVGNWDEDDQESDLGDDIMEAIHARAERDAQNVAGRAVVPLPPPPQAPTGAVTAQELQTLALLAPTRDPTTALQREPVALAPPRQVAACSSSKNKITAKHPAVGDVAPPRAPSVSTSALAAPEAATAASAASGVPAPPRLEPAAGGGETQLSECMRRLLLFGDIPHDVRIIADDGVVNAHRYFLASRSPFFEAKLQGSASNDPWNAMSEVRVHGVTVNVMQHVLLYLYTDSFDLRLDSSEMAPEDMETCVFLMDAASQFGLTRLEKFLRDEVLTLVAQTLDEKAQEQKKREEVRRIEAAQAQAVQAQVAQAAQAAQAVQAAQAAQAAQAQAVHAAQAAQAAAAVAGQYNQGVPQAFMPFPVADVGQSFSSQQSPTMIRLDDEVVVERHDVTPHDLTPAAKGKAQQGMVPVDDAKLVKVADGIVALGATTLMIRNLPRSVRQKRLVKEIDGSGFAGTYDFAYLPSSFGKGMESSGLGYAFVNFEQLDVVHKFVTSWHGTRRFNILKSDAALTVSAAEHQGKEVNLRQWMRKGCRVRNPELRPFIKGEGDDEGHILDMEEDQQMLERVGVAKTSGTGQAASISEDASHAGTASGASGGPAASAHKLSAPPGLGQPPGVLAAACAAGLEDVSGAAVRSIAANPSVAALARNSYQ